MENLGKKVGYLKGMMEGMVHDADSPYGKLLTGMVDLLGDLSDRVEAIDELMDDLNDYVESIDEDLADLEGSGDMDDYLDDEDEEMDFDDELFPMGEDKLHLLRPSAAQAKEEESLAGNLCPQCSRVFFTSLDDDADARYVCPHCGERVKPVPLTPENAPVAKPAEPEE